MLFIPSKRCLERLPIYYQALLGAKRRKQRFLSSRALSRLTQVDSALIRRDVTSTGFNRGVPKKGYPVDDLLFHLKGYLGLNKRSAALIGCGNLGMAIAHYKGFRIYGLDIVALFDNDDAKIGQKVADVTIRPAYEISEVIRQKKIRLAIITTPPVAAQAVTDAAVAGGARAIWCFCPTHLEVPSEVMVRYENLAANLSGLFRYLEDKGL
jgi:redox-sensing transcriptional repressor